MGFFEKRRARKEHEHEERQAAIAAAAQAERQGEIATLEWMVNDARTFGGVDAPGFEEKKGESTFAVLDGVHFIEPRRQPGTYAGRSNGVSFRIAKGVSYRVGASNGRFVPGEDVPTPIDQGTAFVTNQRVVFRGDKATREWAWSKLISLDHDENLPWTSLPVSNRQKTSGLLYDNETADMVRYRLQQGLAQHQGSLDRFISQLTRELEDLRSAPLSIESS